MPFYMAVRYTVIVKLSIALRHKAAKPKNGVKFVSSKVLGLLEDRRSAQQPRKEVAILAGQQINGCVAHSRLIITAFRLSLSVSQRRPPLTISSDAVPQRGGQSSTRW